MCVNNDQYTGKTALHPIGQMTYKEKVAFPRNNVPGPSLNKSQTLPYGRLTRILF